MHKHSLQRSSTFLFNSGLLSIVILLAGCSQPAPDDGRIRFNKASEYHAYINGSFDHVMGLWNQTLENMGDSVMVYTYLDSLQGVSDLGVEKMKRLGDYKGDTAYRENAARFFGYISRVSRHELKESIEMALLPTIPDSVHLHFAELGNRIGYEKEIYIKKLQLAQQKFAMEAEKK